VLIRVNKYIQEIINSITNKLFNGIQKQVKQFIRITLLNRGNKIKKQIKISVGAVPISNSKFAGKSQIDTPSTQIFIIAFLEYRKHNS